MEAALVKVSGSEGLDHAETRLLAATSGYLLCLERAVRVMPAEPVAESLAEGEVVERSAQYSDPPVYEGNGIDEALVACALGPEQPDVIRRSLHVLQPPVHQEIASLHAEGGVIARCLHRRLETRS